MAMVAGPAAQPEPLAATVERATAVGVLRLADGRSARLQGVSAAAEPVRPGGFAQWLDEFLRGWLVAESVRVFPEKMVEDGDGVDLTVTVRLASADRWGERGGARGRFRGFLCFSANWDHVHVPWLFGQLDLAGMTANFSLTNDRDPSPEHSFVVSYLARD